MNVHHELVKVHAPLASDVRRQCVVEQIHHHAFPRADVAVQIQALWRMFWSHSILSVAVWFICFPAEPARQGVEDASMAAVVCMSFVLDAFLGVRHLWLLVMAELVVQMI